MYKITNFIQFFIWSYFQSLTFIIIDKWVILYTYHIGIKLFLLNDSEQPMLAVYVYVDVYHIYTSLCMSVCVYVRVWGFFVFVFYLSRLYAQHGTWTQDPKINSRTLFWLSQPEGPVCMFVCVLSHCDMNHKYLVHILFFDWISKLVSFIGQLYFILRSQSHQRTLDLESWFKNPANRAGD